MEVQTLINTLLPLVCVAIGWFCKELWNAVQDLKEDLSDLRSHISDNYMKKDDFNGRWDEVLTYLRRLEDKLDTLKK